jgi:hypothetical protein
MAGIEGADSFPEGHNVGNKTFYGFQLNPDDGGLVIDMIDDGTKVIKLPNLQDDIIDKYAYKHWVWSDHLLQFQWGDNGHLQVKII